MMDLKKFNDTHDISMYEFSASRWHQEDEYYNPDARKIELIWGYDWVSDAPDNDDLAKSLKHIINEDGVRELDFIAFENPKDAFKMDEPKILKTWHVSEDPTKSELAKIYKEVRALVDQIPTD